MSDGRSQSERERTAHDEWWRICSDHPVVTSVFVGCIAAGIVIGVYLLTDDWSLARRIAGGAVGGAGVALIITAPRMIG